MFNLKELQKYNAELIVAGCLPAIDKEELNKIFDGKTITTKDLDNIDKLSVSPNNPIQDFKPFDLVKSEDQLKIELQKKEEAIANDQKLIKEQKEKLSDINERIELLKFNEVARKEIDIIAKVVESLKTLKINKKS